MSLDTKIIIIGTGFGGLCMGAKLKAAGIDDFIILEKAGEVGGTWRENTYPGAECDIPSALYSFSFAPNPTWDYKWAKQPQIFGYLKSFAEDYGLRPHIRFGVTVTGAAFNSKTSSWTVETDKGPLSCRFLVSAVGQLHHPRLPDLPGSEYFNGKTFHSARWDHALDLQGKDIGVIGAAASAIQFIPEIAPRARRLSVYQRTANFVIDKGDRPYTQFEKNIAKRFPALARLYRFGLWSLGEYFIYPVIKGAPVRSSLALKKWRSDMKKHITDPAMQRALTPNYPMGAKRILFSDRFYAALARENVELVTQPLKSMTADGIETADGTRRDHDIIIYATGFYSNPFLKELDITGENGLTLQDHWRDGAQAYLGIMTAGFPNLFFLYGPNTNTGHTSIVFKLEQQVGYIIQLIREAGDSRISVDPEVERRFNDKIQKRLSKTAWAKIDASWYKDGDRITNNWPGSSLEYKRRLAKPIWNHFEITTRGTG